MAGTLDPYRRKRDFAATPEPKGRKVRKAGRSFVIQKHAARRLHYDLRLEMDGVLRSWAVTRGPSLDPGEKRLAVHVEDHPLDYGDFEGVIPKGYGAGTVIVWDRGTWEPLADAAKGYAKGHLEFALAGEKLGGRWHLVRMQKKPGESRENWLLIKGEDEHARDAAEGDILEERPESVKTGRGIAEVAAEGDAPKAAAKPARKAAPKKATVAEVAETEPPDPAAEAGAKAAPLPDFVGPMLATLRPAPPSGERWVHEIKFDGYRLQARIDAGKVKLLTRSGLDWTRKFGKPVVAALAALPVKSAVLDGELVVEGGNGASDFSALQADLSAGKSDRFLFYGFDLLHLDGFDLRPLPLLKRKAMLEGLLAEGPGLLRYSEHFTENGGLILRHACRLSLEGVISKLGDEPYRSGRAKGWVKSKCSARQEFVIGGYTPSSTSRRAIGSLVLGVYEAGKLEPVGRVGTGFTGKVAADLFARLSRLRGETPFGRPLTAEEGRNVCFVRPELVAEVDFRAWTADGHLRHASFRGLREDKAPVEIVREVPKGKDAAKPVRPPRRRVTFTHPDRIYWPEEGITKEGLADYYTEVWRWIAPHVTGRPLALLRCPTGIGGQQFFQKHAWKGVHPSIRQVTDPVKGGEPMIAIDDLDGLMGLVQSAALEIHPWGSTLADWERPDLLTMDLDPGEGVGWDAILAAAAEVRERFLGAGLAAFVKTSGGKGLHVVAPLVPEADWPAAKAFVKAMADAMAADSPALYVSTISKAKRKGKILIDYLRNQRGMTAVAPYSTRARPGAVVSMPLAWEELGEGIGPASFTLENAPARLAALDADPWESFRAEAVPLRVEGARRRRG